jgi:AcrR family transcriptional regulator
MGMTQRAIDTEDKAARRAAILNAARQRYVADGYQIPSVARIAADAGLAKGTVYLYFRTKEEIFVALLAEEFAALMDDAQSFFANEFGPADLPGFIARYVGYIDTHPELLRLDAMAYGVLEQNLPEAQLRTFKLDLTQRLVETGRRVDAALNLPEGRGTRLLMRTYALTRGLWQSLDYPPALMAVLAAPEFAPIRPDFRAELPAALTEYWRGALSAP